MFQRFFDDGLAQSSFLIGCDRTKQAVVVDPRRDASVYAEAARQAGVTIVAAIETHIHADFVSGAHEFAARGIPVRCGPGSAVVFPHHEVTDNEKMVVGDLSLTFLHTPGHTPEHICMLAEWPSQPRRLFTGDLLFVGAVGRPDLLGDAQTRELADQLYGSLQRVLTFGDDVEVHPGHGAGSLCGTGIGKEPFTTIGHERRLNPLLQCATREEFVTAVLADLPETPSYFARMKRVNRQGPALLGLFDRGRPLPGIRPAAAAALTADGALLLDLRDQATFASGHPAGALNVAFGPKIGYWAGWLLPEDTPIILLADEHGHASEAAVQLLRVGLDRVEGWVEGGFAAWSAAGLPVATFDRLSAADLRATLATHEPVTLLDVRSTKEWSHDHIQGSINIPLGELPDRFEELSRDAHVATICEGGYRSSLAASLLAREGYLHVLNVAGGMAAYREQEIL
jgi:hydroxyacylglutathione hydrolase